MAVPKKRTGASAQGHRRSNWKATGSRNYNLAHCRRISFELTLFAQLAVNIKVK